MTHPELYEEMGIKPPKGVILYGVPGTGPRFSFIVIIIDFQSLVEMYIVAVVVFDFPFLISFSSF